MKHRHPVIVFLLLTLSSVLASIGSYNTAATRVDRDLQQALGLTLQQQRSDVITPDTIRTFNSYLQQEALRGQAVLSLVCEERRNASKATIEAHCPSSVVLRMSDQRPALALMSMAFVWALGCGVRRRQGALPRPVSAAGRELGGLMFSERDDRFFTTAGTEVRFTPMQHRLMVMFFHADDHRLPKQDICETLWPKKGDANETLYTLVRRLKSVLETQTQLTIVCDRSRAYQLTLSKLQ